MGSKSLNIWKGEGLGREPVLFSVLVPAAVAGISIRSGGVASVGCVGVVRFAEIHLEREGKEGEMLKREKTETSHRQTKAAHTVGACPSSRALRLLPKPKGMVCVRAHPHFPKCGLLHAEWASLIPV